MQKETKDLKAITKKFFTLYGAHDIEAMTALCADDAKGQYAPYGREYVVPVRGGLNAFWKGFTQAVPDFHVEVGEMLQAEGNTVVVQAVLGGTISADAPGGIAKKGDNIRIPHAYIIRYNADSKISYIDCYWDNTAINSIKSSAL
jgi:ketosteroid isomerase-like protein